MNPVIYFTAADPKRPYMPPKRHYGGDAGYDLHASCDVAVFPKSFANIPTNIRLAMPKGTWGMIASRSSTFRKKGLIVSPGIIDQGFRGELFAMVYNPTAKRAVVKEGERIIQLIVFHLLVPDMVPVAADRLPKGDRDENGFGSTGS